jgi:hypothetical protein
MTARRKTLSLATTGALQRVRGARGRAVEVLHRVSTAEDREDRAALNAALDAQERGELETISHAELKARLGLD